MKKLWTVLAFPMLLAFAVAAMAAQPGMGGDALSGIEKRYRADCGRAKKKIVSARELYMVENPSASTAEVSLDDLVRAGFLRFSPVCHDGGKYSFAVGGAPFCSKCDAVKKASAADKPPQPAAATGSVSLAKKEPDLLESRINRYLKRDDASLAEQGEEQAARDKKASTAEVAIAPAVTAEAEVADDTAETEIPEGPEQIAPVEGAAYAKGAKDYHREAIEHARKGEVDQAVEKFQKAIELVPSSFIYHYNYALYLAKIESYDQSYVEFQRALRLDPANKKTREMIEKLKKAISSR